MRMRSRQLMTPLVLLAFVSLVVFNAMHASTITGSNVAISSVYEGITDQDSIDLGNIRFVTILTEPRKYHCTMLASTVFNNVTMEVFGWGDKKLHGTTGWWRKLLWFKGILKSVPAEEIVVFVDAGDTLFNDRPDVIKRAYRSVVKSQDLKPENEFIWSAERNCGMKTLTKEQCSALHIVPNDSPYRWMNTGGWIGRAGVGLELFNMVDDDRKGRTNQADQAFVAETHVNRGWKHLHGLDYDQKIFMSVYKSEKDICGWPDPEKKLRNCRTRTVPPIFHFNAGAKDAKIFNKVLHKAWWWDDLQTPQGKEMVDNHPIIVNGRTVKLKDVCPTGYGIVEDKDVAHVRSLINLGAAEKSHIAVE